MAKLATAQIEIKPVLNEQALADVCRRIEDAIAGAIARGYNRRPVPSPAPWPYQPPYVTWTAGSGVTSTTLNGLTSTSSSTAYNTTDAPVEKPTD